MSGGFDPMAMPTFTMSMGGATAPMTAAPGAAQSVTAPPIMTAPSAVPMFTPGVVAGTPPAAMQPPPMFTPGPPAPAAPPVSAPAPGGMIAPPPLAAPGSGAVGIGMAPASATQLQQPPPGIASVARAADPVSASVASGGYGSQVIELPTTSSGVVLPSPPAVYHWFFQHQSNQWSAFSAIDNKAIEAAPTSTADEGFSGEDQAPVVTDGGRYEVDVGDRVRNPVYWSAPSNEIRRCLWLAGGGDAMFPLKEAHSTTVEEKFNAAWNSKTWRVQIDLDDGAVVQLVHDNFFVYYPPVPAGEPLPEGGRQPWPLKRGWAEEISEGELVAAKVDHCILVIPSIFTALPQLSALDFKNAGTGQATMIDCVDSMRSVSQDLVDIHFQIGEESTSSGRVEYLPILCDDLTATADAAVKVGEASLLDTTKKLRRFLARSLMDTMVYGERLQAMVDIVGARVDSVATLFIERNPTFTGAFQLVGHGFGGCLLFDLLSHQQQAKDAAIAAAAAPPPRSAISAPPSPLATAAAPLPAGGFADSDDDEELPEAPAKPAAGAPAAIPAGVTVDSVLASLGYSDFAEKFKEEDVDMEALTTCTDADFKELGISMGKRKKIIAAVSALGQAGAVEAEAAYKAWEAAVSDKKAKKAERRLERRRAAAEEAERRLDSKQAAAATAPAAAAVETSSADTAGSGGAGAGAGPGLQAVKYPVLNCKTRNVFLLGAPLATILALRSTDERELCLNGKISSTDGVMVRTFNVFHPYDALATRMEGLITADAYGTTAVQIPHHMGRKRLHLELQGYLKQASKDLKSSVSTLAGAAWSSIKTQMGGGGEDDAAGTGSAGIAGAGASVAGVEAASASEDPEGKETNTFDMPETSMNAGGRIDHVLQEDPLEVINERLMSMATNSCYWTSRDAILFMLNTIYGLAAEK